LIGLKKKIEREAKKVKNKDDLEFISFIQKRLKTIVKGDINKLKKIQNIIEIKYTKVWEKIKSYNENAPKGKKRKFIYTILEKIFVTYGYESIISEKIAYKMLRNLDVKVCPYCNINYISFSGTNSNKGIRPELDHFYPKSRYPYFAVSFYNLISSNVGIFKSFHTWLFMCFKQIITKFFKLCACKHFMCFACKFSNFVFKKSFQ
jgi:hypothetical protein